MQSHLDFPPQLLHDQMSRPSAEMESSVTMLVSAAGMSRSEHSLMYLPGIHLIDTVG